MKTEYNTVIAGAQMSRLWAEIQRDKAIFPLAQFVVTKDGRTSDICEPLHGVTLSVDDPMLAYFFPPNHFNCRTTVKRLRTGVVTDKYELPDIPEQFRNNTGQTGTIFTDDNRYIASTPKRLLSDFDYVEKDGILISTKAEKWSNSEHERKRQINEYKQRIETAIALKAYFKQETKVLPEIAPDHYSYNYHFEDAPIPNKVADIKVGNIFWEMESYERKFKIGKISAMIKHGQEQANHVVLKLNHNIPVNKISNQIDELIKKGIVKANRIIVVFQDKVVLDIKIK